MAILDSETRKYIQEKVDAEEAGGPGFYPRHRLASLGEDYDFQAIVRMISAMDERTFYDEFPVVVTPCDDGVKRVVDGSHRLIAARVSGVDPVIQCRKFDSELDLRIYVVDVNISRKYIPKRRQNALIRFLLPENKELWGSWGGRVLDSKSESDLKAIEKAAKANGKSDEYVQLLRGKIASGALSMETVKREVGLKTNLLGYRFDITKENEIQELDRLRLLLSQPGTVKAFPHLNLKSKGVKNADVLRAAIKHLQHSVDQELGL